MDVEYATTADVDSVVNQWLSLAEEQLDHGAHVLPDANESRIRDEIAHHAASDGLLVARADADTPGDGVLGFVMVSMERGTFNKDVDRGIVEAIYVIPSRRDEGIGSALLDAAERELADRGAATVALEALAGNDAARRFYRDRGFTPHRVQFERPLESDNHSKEGE